MSVLAISQIHVAARTSAAAGACAFSGLLKRYKSTAASGADPIGIDALGIHFKGPVYRNLSYEELAKHELDNKEGTFINNGTFAVDTGKFTGRSPQVCDLL